MVAISEPEVQPLALLHEQDADCTSSPFPPELASEVLCEFSALLEFASLLVDESSVAVDAESVELSLVSPGSDVP